jgi:hypothetical protein
VVPPTVAPKAPPPELVVEGGRRFRPTYPHLPASDRPGMFVLGMKKCGSSLFNTIVQQLCAANGVGYLSLPDQAFEQNFHVVQLGTSPYFSSPFRDGWVYGGFRQLPDILSSLEFFKARRKLLLVRDPRDALVSDYFSVAYSHSLPPADSARDEAFVEACCISAKRPLHRRLMTLCSRPAAASSGSSSLCYA